MYVIFNGRLCLFSFSFFLLVFNCQNPEEAPGKGVYLPHSPDPPTPFGRHQISFSNSKVFWTWFIISFYPARSILIDRTNRHKKSLPK